MEKNVALSDIESLILHLIKDDLLKYKMTTNLQAQLYKEPNYQSTLIVAILWLSKIWESKLQEEFSEYYFDLLKKVESVDFSKSHEEINKLTQDIFDKLKHRSQSLDTAKRQRKFYFATYDQSWTVSEEEPTAWVKKGRPRQK